MNTNPDALQSDTGGPIERIAIVLSSDFLQPSHAAKLYAYETLVQKLLPGSTLVVLTEIHLFQKVENWLSGLSLSCSSTIAAVAPEGTLTNRRGAIWIQDRFLSAGQNENRKHLIPKTNAEGQHGQLLADYERIDTQDVQVHLDGGDCIVGEDFWLVGAKSVEKTALLMQRPNDLGIAQNKIADIDRRALHVVGYHPTDIEGSWQRLKWIFGEAHSLATMPIERNCQSQSDNPSTAYSTFLARFVSAAFSQSFALKSSSRKLYQPWHHIDLMVSATGTRRSGKPLLLVADPTMPPSPVLHESRSFAVRLDAVAKRLSDNGFAVERNPAPYYKNTNEPHSRPTPRGYNNVLVQNIPSNIVWVPQFGDIESELTDVDLANCDIWASLGFQVIPVHGWSATATNQGALRCAAKVLTRSPSS